MFLSKNKNLQNIVNCYKLMFEEHELNKKLTAAQKFEFKVNDSIQNWIALYNEKDSDIKKFNFKSKHTGGNVYSCDIKITSDNEFLPEFGIEVKLNKSARMGLNYTTEYVNGKWIFNGDEGTAKVIISEELNKNVDLKKFIDEIKTFTKNENINLLKSPDPNDKDAITVTQLKDFLKKYAYITTSKDGSIIPILTINTVNEKSIGELVIEHYMHKKADCMQVGDNFVLINGRINRAIVQHSKNPKMLQAIPQIPLNSKGKLILRITFRNDFTTYTINTDVYLDEIISSEYSFLKQNEDNPLYFISHELSKNLKK